MAMFQFSARQVELNFCDQIKCTVPLTDEVQKKVQDAAKELLRVSQAAKDSDNKKHTLDDLCDSVMDAIDEILGEGMSDQILGMKEGYTFWDACDVFKYKGCYDCGCGCYDRRCRRSHRRREGRLQL